MPWRGNAMDDRRVTPDAIEREHQAEIQQRLVWSYLLGIPAAGFAIMLVLIAVLDALNR
jgi:hypothetical protein